ncbi:hypothetical protein QR680_013851 [Steinernema hermaphroditum]|uniref:Uncharacterized protein n=1 Tax=Steinernema hermaphroditum TaxID=289476 RepID=A0AA39I8A8_9BILA|nr:hypothetical protein QR680_013851 [Steinernema hermaphroditum]
MIYPLRVPSFEFTFMRLSRERWKNFMQRLFRSWTILKFYSILGLLSFSNIALLLIHLINPPKKTAFDIENPKMYLAMTILLCVFVAVMVVFVLFLAMLLGFYSYCKWKKIDADVEKDTVRPKSNHGIRIRQRSANRLGLPQDPQSDPIFLSSHTPVGVPVVL